MDVFITKNNIKESILFSKTVGLDVIHIFFENVKILGQTLNAFFSNWSRQIAF